MPQKDDAAVDVAPAQPGRKRDPSREAPRGHAGGPRRSGRRGLVIDAVTYLKRNQVDLELRPDTGTLRGDLLGLFKPRSMEESERRLKLMTGLASLLSQEQALADAANAAVVQPWAEAHFTLMQRAIVRGEVSAGLDVATEYKAPDRP